MCFLDAGLTGLDQRDLAHAPRVGGRPQVAVAATRAPPRLVPVDVRGRTQRQLDPLVVRPEPLATDQVMRERQIEAIIVSRGYDRTHELRGGEPQLQRGQRTERIRRARAPPSPRIRRAR